MAEVKFTEASPLVLSTAEDLIEQYHLWLKKAKILFVFRSEAQKSGGRLILGQAAKVPAKFQVSMDYDFIIWLAEDEWTALSLKQKIALVDHELCHCKGMENKWQIQPHDVEEFKAILDRYGAWNAGLIKATQGISQPKLFEDTVEISAGGLVATVTGDQLRALNEHLAEELA